MKLLALCFIFFSLSAFGSVTKDENQHLLDTLRGFRTHTVWSCGQDALTLFQVKLSGSGLLSGNQILAIQDEQICASLHVTCPFVAAASEMPIGDAKYSYWATRGKYEQTVVFLSDAAGMKAARVRNTSRPEIVWSSSWYFHPGECILH